MDKYSLLFWKMYLRGEASALYQVLLPEWSSRCPLVSDHVSFLGFFPFLISLLCFLPESPRILSQINTFYSNSKRKTTCNPYL